MLHFSAGLFAWLQKTFVPLGPFDCNKFGLLGLQLADA